jgi:hypothetical protein
MIHSNASKESLLNKESASDGFKIFNSTPFFLDSSSNSLLTSAFNTNNFFSSKVSLFYKKFLKKINLKVSAFT